MIYNSLKFQNLQWISLFTHNTPIYFSIYLSLTLWITLSVTMGDKEEKSILHDEMESTQDSSEMFGQSCFHLFILGRPHQKATILLSFGQSCFMECLVCNDLCHRIHLHNIMKLIQSWAFRVSIILLLCLNFLYGFFKG